MADVLLFSFPFKFTYDNEGMKDINNYTYTKILNRPLLLNKDEFGKTIMVATLTLVTTPLIVKCIHP